MSTPTTPSTPAAVSGEPGPQTAPQTSNAPGGARPPNQPPAHADVNAHTDAHTDVNAHAHAAPAQPQQRPAFAPVAVPLGKMLYLCVAALGFINLFLGYVSAGDGDSTNLYKAAVAVYTVAPTMLFLGGLVALRTVLPRERPPGALPAMVTTAVFVPLVLSAISSDGAGDLQTLFLVFGAVQFVLAWFAYLFDTGLIATRR